MKQEQFIENVRGLLPGCGREAAQGWIDFAAENVAQEQYVNFVPEPNQTAAVEKWLDTLYAGLYQAKQEFGTEVASQICNLPLSQNHCLYPWEMKEAAAYLQNGGDLNKVSQLSVDGEFDSAAPVFPTLENTHHQEGDKFRYYITNDALNVGTFPHMAGMDVRESIKPVDYENGAVKAFGFIDYPQPLTLEQERDHCLVPSSQNAVVRGTAWIPISDEQRASRRERNVNYLKTVEMGLEQNYNQLDGLINNQELPRANQGYVILESKIVGHKEFVLAENPKAPQPFATWMRNMQNDEHTGGENFFWGHYFTDEAAAHRDFRSRVREEEQDLAGQRPSILSQLKSDVSRKDFPTVPEPGRKKDAPER